MGFVINGKIVDLTSQSKYAARIKDAQKEIIEKYELTKKTANLRFVYPDNLIRKNPDNPNRPDHPNSFTLDYRETVISPDGNIEDWRYFEVATPNEKGLLEYSPQSEEFRGHWLLTIRDIDKIFWLLCIASRVIGSKNEDTQKRKYIKLDDTIEKAREAIRVEKDKLIVRNAVYGENVTGGLTDEKIREIATIFFVSDAASRDIAVVKTELMTYIDKVQDGYRKFISLTTVKRDPDADLKFIVQKLIDNDKIKVDDKNGEQKWRIYDKDTGKMKNVIVPISPTAKGKEKEFLVSYLMKDSTLAASLKVLTESIAEEVV
uniref:Uncharacterized protein n=1 Tax=viral metagenome TaxID=1070528 RepID=A0A6M3MIG9_9ZZZZ